ncbi:HPr kinase/phosphorylase [Clostridium paraputrificum]|nr:HPr kinase/phosphorylase [Clostridium paraputrificum]
MEYRELNETHLKDIIEAAAVNYRYSLMSNVSAVDIIESRMNLVSDK